MKGHTIGEVLNRLKDEFDDITISKIRFLEAEGLISPDRSESGYRQFTDGDVERLRYVLRSQRDRYLPLKVIKEELSRLDAGLPLEDDTAGDGPPTPAPPRAVAAEDTAVSPRGFLDEGAPTHLDEDELVAASGLSETDLGALHDHGLLGGGPTYDGEDLRIAKLAGDLLGRGLEPRHLRMYRQFADREAALAEQLVAPLLRQRNPDSRRDATHRAEHLATAGEELRRMLLVKQLRALLRS